MPQGAHMYRTRSAMDNNVEIDGELIGESDEPPERSEYFNAAHSTHSPALDPTFIKSLPPAFARRESLLTRGLHSPDPDHIDDEHHRARAVIRGMSIRSNPSVASTASLTSDNDLTSPGTRDSTPSPPLPPTLIHTPVPTLDKAPLSREPSILGKAFNTSPEKTVEADLGRRRCITFACGRKPSQVAIETVKEKPEPEQKPAEAPAPVKRKCAITFACPARPAIQTAPTQLKIKTTRNTSPAPTTRAIRPLPSPKPMPKAHRGSDATVKNDSPKSLRKTPSSTMRRRKYSDDTNDVPSEERRFHEFAPLQSEAEQWLEESTCYRNRLTVNDTLIKETIIRRIGEEVEEEALEDEDFDEDDLEDDEDDEEEDIDEDEEDEDADEGASDDEAVSDAGFQTDDEEGFAVSDSENEDDSDNEWWTAGRSTAATSTEHLEHLRLSPRHRSTSQSSMESGSDKHVATRPPQGKVKRKTKAMRIHRPGTPDLPDSTDFVCGTLDEDRPLEQAYISCLEERRAAKHKARPQDIDPTFPTSDPEMDEEDDDSESDNDKVDESDHPLFLHGHIDLNNDESERRGRHPSITGTRKKTPSPPHQRLRSPPPAKRAVHRSPPPPTKRGNMRSPAPAKRSTLKSPAPSKRIALKSPPPAKRATHKSPPPARHMFGQTSPRRMRSPAPCSRRLTSPPPSRRTSHEGTPGISFTPRATTLAFRPQPTHTASLPRVASTAKLGKNRLTMMSPSETDDYSAPTSRGAIDIVKGLEKKRQRRREKLYQKHCNRAGKDREHRRPKPGKGAERMREVGLELAAYKGKKEHMLSY